MAYRSRFSSQTKPIIPAAPKVAEVVRVDWRGLDLVSPYDVIEKYRTPSAKNFRIYAQEGDDRRVAVRSRNGSGTYLQALGSVLDSSNISTTGASDKAFSAGVPWLAMKYTASDTGPLDKIEVNIKSDATSRGPVIVEIYDNNSGAPGTKIADSGILSSSISTSYGYVSCRFTEAPHVTNGNVYWIVLRIQDDGSGQYYWSGNTSSTLALSSSNQGLSWSSTTYSLNFKAYIADDVSVKGLFRFTPQGTGNTTIMAIGNSLYKANDNTGALTSILSGLNANATDVNVTYADDKAFFTNGYDTLRTLASDMTTVSTLTHANLPVLSNAVFHKNRLIGVSATDKNKLIWSEAPGNDDGAGKFWYEAYLSTSFVYVPAPKASDPITAIISFQDYLVIFTSSDKYILYGSDPGSFTIRQAAGRKGAVSQKAVFADENFVYFVSQDGSLYRFNGSNDELLSDRVQPEINKIADTSKIVLTKWKNMIRMYYPGEGSSVNNRCLLWHTVFKEWMLDTDSYVTRAIPWTDADDDPLLIEASSKSPTAHFAERNTHDIGKAIDFEYRCFADSMGSPGKLKRIVKMFPLLEAYERDYPMQIALGKNRQSNPSYEDYGLTTGGAIIGDFLIGDGTVIGNSNEFSPKRLPVSGYAYYWQLCLKRRAINNTVQFVGYMLSYRTKRL
jgi:hypothetical protein